MTTVDRAAPPDAIRDILAAAAAPGVLSLAGGLPAPDSFPLTELVTVLDEVMSSAAAAALQYGPVEGVPAMRAGLAARAGETGGHTDPDRVLVTSGSQQGLALTTNALVAPGDTVALEDPGYLGAVRVFRQAGADLLAVPGDEDGMDTEALAGRLRRGARCRLVYVVPHFHNPTAAVLTEERRRHLAELAGHYGFLIVEDDPYADLAFDGVRLPSIDAFSDRVIRLLSLSKTLCPGFRVAGLVAPPALIGPLTTAKQDADLQTNTFGQHVVSRLLSRPGFLPRHLLRLQSLYRTRAGHLAGLLGGLGWVTFRAPRGGLFFWAAITTAGVDAATLTAAAIEEGLAIVPGPPFCIDRDGSRHLRLSFATLSPSEMPEAVRRLELARARVSGPRGAAAAG
ncbi:PLP-dependent aminotransferase family protein [Amycolatopsis mediterranei]|uniref:aminotransferase-like domain-containing protein n=1 Tax=Amycolatopsis mediterranei TaxID=33910 RepID=UPI003322911C